MLAIEIQRILPVVVAMLTALGISAAWLQAAPGKLSGGRDTVGAAQALRALPSLPAAMCAVPALNPRPSLFIGCGVFD